MSLTRWATRRDQSEPDILRAIYKAGARYILLDPFDVLVLFRGRVHMLEVKTPKSKTTRRGRKTRNQELLVQEGWPVQFVETPEEALQAISVGSWSAAEGALREIAMGYPEKRGMTSAEYAASFLRLFGAVRDEVSE